MSTRTQSGEALRGQHLHFDCASGAAGDMTLGALLHLGVPQEVVEAALARIGMGGRLTARSVVKSGIAAVDVTVRTDAPGGGAHGHGPGEHSHAHGHGHGHGAHEHAHAHEHGDHEHEHAHAHAHAHAHGDHAHTHEHAHEHGDHAHTHEHEHGDHEHEHGDHAHTHEHGDLAHAHDHHHYREIRARIVGVGLDDGVVGRALDIFDRVARAESKLHGVALEEVAFHEVGAIDSIVDIVGTAAALAWLAPASASATSVAMGHGTVRCAHGILPVPSPAALEILREAGAVMRDGGLARELCTPTGAAILAATVTEWRPMPDLVALAVGFGAGDADFPDRPNVLRVTVGRRVDQPSAPANPTSVFRIEANIDDMSSELCSHAAAAAFRAGALDVWWTPIVMKKGRPALQLSALAAAAVLEDVVHALLTETTTIGVRFDPVERRVLPRHQIVVETAFGPIAFKVASLDGVEINAAPEFEACRAAAEAHGVPLKRVYAAAIAAYDARR